MSKSRNKYDYDYDDYFEDEVVPDSKAQKLAQRRSDRLNKGKKRDESLHQWKDE